MFSFQLVVLQYWFVFFFLLFWLSYIIKPLFWAVSFFVFVLAFFGSERSFVWFPPGKWLIWGQALVSGLFFLSLFKLQWFWLCLVSFYWIVVFCYSLLFSVFCFSFLLLVFVRPISLADFSWFLKCLFWLVVSFGEFFLLFLLLFLVTSLVFSSLIFFRLF